MIAFLCAALAALTGCGQRSDLTIATSEKEANRILVELEQRGISDLKLTRETRDRKQVFIISTTPDQLSTARQILVQLNLPREERGGLGAMVNSAGLIPSKSDERAKLMHAIAQELEQTLETADRVVSARVHLVIPEVDLSLSADPAKAPKPSATVLVKYLTSSPPANATDAQKAAAALPPMKLEEVQQLVSRSVQGLDIANVHVTFTTTSVQPTTAQKTAAASAATATTSDSGSGGSNKLLIQLYSAVAGLGLLCILLIVKLVKRGKRPAAAA